MYNAEQLDQYFRHINYPKSDHARQPLEFLRELHKRQLARVPFESLSLHYSKTRLLSLDSQDLFHKIVVRGKGGYCMENNTFFGTVLRSLGFELINVGGRVSNATGGRSDNGWMGWNHMINLVTVDNQRFLVDAGFGVNGPSHPLPLDSPYECVGIAPQDLKLEYKSLAKHTDSKQRVWVYSHRESENVPWIEAYSFTEIEFFPEDFVVMNLHTMTAPQSYFVQVVMAQRIILNEKSGGAEGVIVLHMNYVKRRIGEVTEIIETLQTEEQRVRALEKWFRIVLTQDEQEAIRDLPSELRG